MINVLVRTVRGLILGLVSLTITIPNHAPSWAVGAVFWLSYLIAAFGNMSKEQV